MLKLILNLRGLLELLIVVDAKDTRGQIRVEKQSAGLWREETRARMTGHHESSKSLVVRQVNTQRGPIKLRLLPRNWKGDRRVQEHIEVVCIVGALIEIVGIDHDVL